MIEALKLISLRHYYRQTKYICNSNASSWLPAYNLFKKRAHESLGAVKHKCVIERSEDNGEAVDSDDGNWDRLTGVG